MKVCRETSQALWEVLQLLYVCASSTQEEWKSISNHFESIWNFPHCIGVLEEKHVVMQAPYNSGPHSIVLMAICDAHYRIVIVDVGDSDHRRDGGVSLNSSFSKAMIDGTVPFPPDRPLPGTSEPNAPYVIVGDEAFRLRVNIMRPYSGRNVRETHAIFNYPLSRACRVIKNSFGILSARWHIFLRPIIAEPENVGTYTKAAIVLHNLQPNRLFILSSKIHR